MKAPPASCSSKSSKNGLQNRTLRQKLYKERRRRQVMRRIKTHSCLLRRHPINKRKKCGENDMLNSQRVESFKKSIFRRVRYLGTVERIWSAIKYDPRLSLPIGIELDVVPGDIIIDCGANVGNVTSLFARTGAIVYAFEPHPLCFSILTRRFNLMSNVFCNNVGVMDCSCVLALRTVGAHQQWDAIDVTVGASFIIDWEEKINLIEQLKTSGALTAVDPILYSTHQNLDVTETQVECLDLDVFIRGLKKRVRLLKLDIEGSEIAVLNRLLDSGTIDFIDLVVTETHEKWIPSLREGTDALRHRIEAAGLTDKIRLDWY
jgi:FkbM family methyltransferase